MFCSSFIIYISHHTLSQLSSNQRRETFFALMKEVLDVTGGVIDRVDLVRRGDGSMEMIMTIIGR
ncbi:hypothetical protein [Keuraliba virus]|uniref:Uncharacterized protein n=1 Tax=Keuraliba virus TaxID=380440 RepID=A0A0D3R1S0_9RHAB|nr:hypothetical protein [Keuraliba virus]AJR28571.1 hypothetical protein [Keuraliba virus]